MSAPYDLFLGKNYDVLPAFGENVFDSCVCDPPYGLKFMGKKWDYQVPSVAEWKVILRSMKPGAYLLAFGGSRTFHRMVVNIEDAGFEIRDTLMWLYGSGFPKSLNVAQALDKAQSELGQRWEGYGTALKPAHEPIVLARKPLEGTVAQNVMKWGTGGLNIDGCRIDAEEEGTTNLGRFPANVLHDGSDEVLALFPDAAGQQGDLVGHSKKRRSKNGIFGQMEAAVDHEKRKEIDKSAARFFYCPKTNKKDRNEGCENLPALPGGMVSENSGQHITRREVDYQPPLQNNTHPTVKPTKLMRYLVRLVTPPNGLVLDPYMGSGSTGKAALPEGFGFVGVDDENVEVARARCEFAWRQRVDPHG